MDASGLSFRSTSSPKTRIKTLVEDNNIIRQKNRIDQLQKRIVEYQKKVTTKSSALNILNMKIKGIDSQISEIKFQFDDLINFEGYCLQQLEILQDYYKKILNYCFHETLQFSILDIVSGEARKKLKEISFNKLRKHFGFIVNQEESEYFSLLRQIQQTKQESFWLIKPKQYLSVSKKRTINEINNFLLNQQLPLALIDRRSILFQDTVKNKALNLRINSFFGDQINPDFERYNLIIIEIDTWAFSIKYSETEYGGVGKYKIFKYKDARLVIPITIPILIVMNCWGPDQFMSNFKIIDLQFSTQDFQEITHHIIAKQRTKAVQKEQLFKQSLKVQNSFMSIVHFICKKTQNFNLKNKQVIKNLTNMIQELNQKRKNLRQAKNHSHVKDVKHNNDPKLCELVSKILELAITYFPSHQQTSFYFRDILSTSFHYLEMEGITGKNSVIYLIIQFLTEGLADKFPFIYFFYIKIHAIQEGLATIMQSVNLSAIGHPKDEVYNSFRQGDKQANFFKYLPFPSLQLQKIYTKILKTNIKEQNEINHLIEQQKGLSLFNKSILKRALVPKIFEKQVGQKIAVIQNLITLKNKMFLRRYVSKHNLFCVCDASYWLSKLKFPDEFKLILFSQYTPGRWKSFRQEKQVKNTGNVIILFDDLDNIEDKNEIISDLIKVNKPQVSFILFLKEFIRPDFQQSFKFIPFQRITSIFQIKQLAKVSRSTYSAIFNKIIHFKDEMIKRKTFNQRISYSLLFEKIREKIMNRQEYTADEVVMHVQWGYFQWDKSYIALDKSLSFILASLEANKDRISYYVIEKSFLQKSNQILKQSRVEEFDIAQALKLSKKLKNQSSNLQIKIKTDYKKRTKDDVFYRQLQYKKSKMNQQTIKLKKVADIFNGKMEVTYVLVLQLEDIIKNFDFATFGRIFSKYLNWKRLEMDRNVINLSEIQSELNLYILFENFLYAYNEFVIIEPKNIVKMLQQYELEREDAYSQASSRRSKYSRDSSQVHIARQSSIKKRCENSNVSKKKLQLNKCLQRSSVKLIDLLITRELPKRPNQQQKVQNDEKQYEIKLMLGTFRNCLYIKDNRVIGLKPVLLREQRQMSNIKSGEITLFNNSFRIKTVDISLLYKQKVDSYKEHVSSRFTPSIQ